MQLFQDGLSQEFLAPRRLLPRQVGSVLKNIQRCLLQTASPTLADLRGPRL